MQPNYFIKLNSNGFCTEFTVMIDDELEGFIKIPANLYPSNTGQKFDAENMCWLDEYDQTLAIPIYEPPLSEREQMELDNYTNTLYLTALADLNV